MVYPTNNHQWKFAHQKVTVAEANFYGLGVHIAVIHIPLYSVHIV